MSTGHFCPSAKTPGQIKTLERILVASLPTLLEFALAAYSCAGAVAFVGGETSVAGVKCVSRDTFV